MSLSQIANLQFKEINEIFKVIFKVVYSEKLQWKYIYIYICKDIKVGTLAGS